MSMVTTPTAHHNDVTHLDEGVTDDAVWQRQWQCTINLPMRWYYALQFRIGCRFVQRIMEELKGVQNIGWNF